MEDKTLQGFVAKFDSVLEIDTEALGHNYASSLATNLGVFLEASEPLSPSPDACRPRSRHWTPGPPFVLACSSLTQQSLVLAE